jgi:CRP-like cAMP-binding protein
MTDIKTFLRGLPAFERFSERQINALLDRLHIETHASGTVLFRQDEQEPALYIVISGVLQMSHQSLINGDNGDNTREAHAGEVIGHLALVPNMPSPSTCTAVGEVTVASLSYDDYNALFLLAPGIAHQFQYMVATQLAHYLQEQNKSLRQHLDSQRPTASRSFLERLLGA